MKSKKTPEWIYILIVSAPFIYLFTIWNSLPEKIPMHFNYKGEIDRWGEKMEIILIPILLPLLTYLIMLIVPKIDPKKKIKEMGSKFDKIKFIIILAMSALACYIIYCVKNEELNTNAMYIIIGVLIAGLGNYMQTIKPNYFIGVKTPWTLENEAVWKKTHQLAGKLWLFAGLLMIIISLSIKKENFSAYFIAIILIISIVPIVYSYWIYKNEIV